MKNYMLEGIFRVSELIDSLKKLDASRYIVIGNSDKNGRNDMYNVNCKKIDRELMMKKTFIMFYLMETLGKDVLNVKFIK